MQEIRGLEVTPFESGLADVVSGFDALLALHNDSATLYGPDGDVAAYNLASAHLRRITRWNEVQEGSLARSAFAEALEGRAAAYEAHVRSAEGEKHLRTDLTPVLVNEQVVGVLEFVREVRVAFEEKADVVANYGLPSSDILHDRALRLLLQFRRDNRPFAVHLISVAADSIDNQGLIIEWQRVTAERLLATVRRIDTVARLGNYFVVLQPEIYDTAGVRSLLDRLMDELREPMPWEGRMRTPVVRIGTAFATPNTSSLDELFVEAELALGRDR